MRPPPYFAPGGFRNGDAEMAGLIAPDSPLGEVLEIIGRGWTRMGVSRQRSRDRDDASDGLLWFARGVPFYVAIGLGPKHVEVWTVDDDICYFTPDEPRTRLALVVNAPSVVLLGALASAIHSAGAIERAARTWCAICGRFAARVGANTEDLCEACYSLSRGIVA